MAPAPIIRDNWLVTMRRVLIDSFDAKLGIDEQRTARLLAGLILLFIIVELGVGTAFAVIDPGGYGWSSNLGHVRLLSTLLLIVLYGLSRVRAYKIAIWATLVTITLTVFLMFLSNGQVEDVYLLSYIAIPIAFSFLFLPIQHTILFACLCTASVAAVPVLLPNIPFSRVFVENISFLGIMAATLVGINIYTRQIAEARTRATRESEARYRTLIEQAADGIVITDLDSRIVEANQSFCTIVGYSKAELQSKRLPDLAVPEDLEAVPIAIQALTQGKVIIRARRLIRKDGVIVHIEVSAKQLPDGNIQSIIRDRTETIRLEKARQEQEDFFRAIFENSSDAVFLTDSEDIVTYVGPSMERLFGTSMDELMHQSRFEFVHPDDKDRLRQAVAFVKQVPGRIMRLEYQRRHKDGHWMWVESILTNMLHVPAVASIVINLRDITDRKQTETELQHNRHDLEKSRDALHRQNRIFESMLASITDGVVVANERGEFSVFNKPAHDLLGVGPIDSGPESWTDAYNVFRMDRTTPYPPGELPLARAIRGEACEQEKLVIAHPLRGEFVTLSISGNPIRDENGALYGGVVVFRDVTEQQKSEQAIIDLNATLEERVQQRTMELQAAIKELEGFSYTVSHDLRAPLRGIDGYSRILLRDFYADLPPVAQQRINAIRTATQRMSTLIDDLLEFSRLNRQTLRYTTVNMQALAHTVLAELAGEREGRTFDISVAALPPATADPAMIKQVFQNLIANAIKFTRPRTIARIDIGYIVEGDRVTYYVRDNGVGFDMAYVDKLFGVFQRLHTEKEFEGTGVGLAIVQNVIQRHKGRIWVEAAVDQGTTFYFSIGTSDEIL